MARFTVNGKEYFGNQISVVNGKVIVDGVPQPDSLSGVVEVRILEGEVKNLSSDASIVAGLVLGNVSAGGSVSCDDVDGSVQAGGSVQCSNVGGNVMAGGSVRYTK